MRFTPTFLLPFLALSIIACESSTASSSIAPTGVPSGVAPTVTAISPASGSMRGAARIVVTGSGLSHDATASFGGGAPAKGFWDPRQSGTTLIFYTQAHTAGAVGVVVTNPDGQSARLNNAYTFVPQQSFDFDGDWSGFGNNGQDSAIRFSIQDGKVLSVTCESVSRDPDATRIFSPPLPVTNGEFFFAGAGVTFSGRVVAAGEATGRIDMGQCQSDAYDATKY